jgi:hypothetical protein
MRTETADDIRATTERFQAQFDRNLQKINDLLENRAKPDRTRRFESLERHVPPDPYAEGLERRRRASRNEQPRAASASNPILTKDGIPDPYQTGLAQRAARERRR